MTADHSTNFFARQALARKSSRNQVILFAFAVTLIVLTTTMAIRFAWYLYIGTHDYHQRLSKFVFFDPAFFIFMSMAIVIVILGASAYKMTILQNGGGAVAEMLGARRIEGKTEDQAERRLINVVEEMAIASGIPVPQIYILDSESNINAFAAGLEISDAAVTVTRGALNKLSRDELQGVIGHEFSHILNGDMRLNVQLIGILFGILFLGIAGRKFLSGGRVSLRAGFPVVAAGIFLVMIGYIGSFLGRIIQCSISRQREFLADASAVQFTRNPSGLAGALKKIGADAFGSTIVSQGARQASHLFFGESHPDNLFPCLATHPPLALRIRLLDPSFDGKFTKIKDEGMKPHQMYAEQFAGTARYNRSPVTPVSILASGVTASIGNPTPDHLGQGQAMLNAIPEDIREIAGTPQGAASLIFALLANSEPGRQERQATILGRSMILQGNTDRVFQLSAQLSGLSNSLTLPLIQLAMPSLQGMPGMEKRNFLLILNGLVNDDGRLSLLELSVQWILEKSLDPSRDMFQTVRKFSFSQVGLDIVVLLRALACAGHADDQAKAELAFYAGLARIPELEARKPVFSFEANASYAKMNRSLTNLTDASFKIKESVIDACAHCAFADKTVTAEEGELLRVVALALQCPLPPFIASSAQQ